MLMLAAATTFSVTSCGGEAADGSDDATEMNEGGEEGKCEEGKCEEGKCGDGCEGKCDEDQGVKQHPPLLGHGLRSRMIFSVYIFFTINNAFFSLRCPIHAWSRLLIGLEKCRYKGGVKGFASVFRGRCNRSAVRAEETQKN